MIFHSMIHIYNIKYSHVYLIIVDTISTNVDNIQYNKQIIQIRKNFQLNYIFHV